MSNRFGLPDINFFDKTPEKILQEMLEVHKDITGHTYLRSDPRLKAIEAQAYFVTLERNRLEHALKQLLLAYANDDALDHLGVETDTPRIPATASSTTMRFNLVENRTQTLTIPSGTRFRASDNIYFATNITQFVQVGLNTFDVIATCTEVGSESNGYLPGEITTLVDPLPYVTSVTNISESAGGADIEDDDSYANRIRTAPEKFSTAGPEGAYEYWALSASADIGNVKAYMPSPGTTEIVVLLKNGELPTQEHLNAVLSACSGKTVRPLTDRVIASAPQQILYSNSIQYWIPQSKAAVAVAIQTKIEAAYNDYLEWQRSVLGRDIDPSELIYRLKDAGASKVVASNYDVIEVNEVSVAKEENVSLQLTGYTDD